MRASNFIFIFLTLLLSKNIYAIEHPCLILTKQGVDHIKREPKHPALFIKVLKQEENKLKQAMAQPIDIPIPQDAGGGYTHEQHKRNYNNMYNAGMLFQLTGDTLYAAYIKKMLYKYAEIYPNLPLHPVNKSSYRGKLFWQGLNESVWLVYTAQAYDCIYDYLNKQERTYIENNLFKPMVQFFTIDNKSTFNKIHNHATWAVAAVGMISYVMQDKDMIEKALFGLKKNGESGFIKQINQLFSPDGYFEEGPYYQRYSLQPFIMFAQAIDNNEPERNIFKYKDGVLIKAVNTLLQMTEKDGELFHLNDALDKCWNSTEIIWGVNIAYSKTLDKQLLSIAQKQGSVTINEYGYKVAKDIESAIEFQHKTLVIRDGENGDEGGIGILRSQNDTDESCAVLKYTSQGMGHGHFDKLSLTYYDNGTDILQDYGAVRFLNIEQKNGGRYLDENESFGKQTIGHNTLTVDGKSHYNGSLKEASKHSPIFYSFANTDSIKLISAKDNHAAPGTSLHRSIFMITYPYFEHPLIIDVFKVESKEKHQYDLAYYYKGHIIHMDYPYTAFTTTRSIMGTQNGYQHLWTEAKAAPQNRTASTTWLNNNRFYTLTSTTNHQSEIFLNRIGGSDPNFNLRNDPCLILRQKDQSNYTFVSTLEAHGDFNPRQEYTLTPYGKVKDIQILIDTSEYTVIKITNSEQQNVIICISNKNNDAHAEHQISDFQWTGVYNVQFK